MILAYAVGATAAVLIAGPPWGRHGTMRAMLTRVTNIADAGGSAGTVHVVSNRQRWAGGPRLACKVAEAALADLMPGAMITAVSYAGRDPSIRQATPYRYLVTFTRPAS